MKIDGVELEILQTSDPDYARWNAEGDAAVAMCVALAILGVVVALGFFIWIIASSTHQVNCEKNMAQIMRKYETIDPKKVNASTISSFHKELRDCFDSDADYSNYIGSWTNNKQLEIFNIDTLLLYYYNENRYSNESDDGKEY